MAKTEGTMCIRGDSEAMKIAASRSCNTPIPR
jgi:hypothetical protein